ncbi:MAG TPA: GNAT family protein [Rhodanobacteraceae bacterium]|nr:GNAT family protein [Rhodanobacteraceae bacterium]
MTVEIVTARLRLDALQRGDADALFAYRGDPVVSRYQGWKPVSAADAGHFIETQLRVAPDTPGTWWQRAIRLRDSGELIGDFGLHFMDADTVELGITLAPAHQRQGYAREALEVVLDFVFGGLHKHRVVASVDPRNTACVKLLEGLGMRREAHFRQSVRCGEEWADDLVFALLEREWLAAPAGEDG